MEEQLSWVASSLRSVQLIAFIHFSCRKKSLWRLFAVVCKSVEWCLWAAQRSSEQQGLGEVAMPLLSGADAACLEWFLRPLFSFPY